MQITTDMIAAAWIGWKEYSSKNKNALGEDLMRAALEAALGTESKNTSAIVMSLRMACCGSNITDDVRESCSHASNGLVLDAAACIEELAHELDKIAPPKREGWVDHPARATLERWGLK